MIHHVPVDKYASMASVASGLAMHGMAHAILAGSRPGYVVANRETEPTSLFLIAPEGKFAWTYFAGDPSDLSFVKSVGTWFCDDYCSEQKIGFSMLAVDDPSWDSSVIAFLDSRKAIRDERLHLTNPPVVPEWRSAIPAGYKVSVLNRDLISSGTVIHEIVANWLVNNFGSQEAFLANGLGAVAVYDNEIVAWCLADSVVGNRADIGVETLEEHQRRGLAYITTCQVLEQAMAQGIHYLGWHCHAVATGSVKTATKAGFVLQEEYTLYPFYIDTENHTKFVEIVASESSS